MQFTNANIYLHALAFSVSTTCPLYHYTLDTLMALHITNLHSLLACSLQTSSVAQYVNFNRSPTCQETRLPQLSFFNLFANHNPLFSQVWWQLQVHIHRNTLALLTPTALWSVDLNPQQMAWNKGTSYGSTTLEITGICCSLTPSSNSWWSGYQLAVTQTSSRLLVVCFIISLITLNTKSFNAKQTCFHLNFCLLISNLVGRRTRHRAQR